MLDGLRKWFAMRSFVKRLGPELKKRYGKQKLYTPAQVNRTIEQGGYNTDYLGYALCMYCSPGAFAHYHRESGEACDYTSMRSEVANRYFSGDASFDPIDASQGAFWWHGAHLDADHGGNFDASDAGGYSGGDSSGGGGE